MMKNYHLLPSVRGDLLARLGRHAEAAGGVRTRCGDDAERAGEDVSAGACAEERGNGRMSVDVSHPKRDEPALWMGHPNSLHADTLQNPY